MANKQETSMDIIAEMLGARTEFPFVYLMGESDTPEVIDFKTKEIIAPRKINIRRVTVKELAYRLEAAHKRERGNTAKLREALIEIERKVNSLDENCAVDPVEIRDIARAALAEPPRNCDRFADELDAQLAFLNEVWLISINRETMTEQDAYEKWTDEMRTGYGRWLLAPATAQEGDAK